MDKKDKVKDGKSHDLSVEFSKWNSNLRLKIDGEKKNSQNANKVSDK